METDYNFEFEQYISYDEKNDQSESDFELQQSSKVKKSAIRKKDCNFEQKTNVATEVSKYPNIFDIANKSYSDKIKETQTWNKISTATGIDPITCKQLWVSLKNSAKYYAVEKKIPYKSGASAADVLPDKYRSEWQFKDIMGFYTVPKHRSTISMVSMGNAGNSEQSQFQYLDESLLIENTSSFYEHELPCSKPKKKDRMVENITNFASSFSNYLEQKTLEKSEEPRQLLKFFSMWANFDSLITTLDEDLVVDLNLEITRSS